MTSQNPWKTLLLTLKFATTKATKYQLFTVDTPKGYKSHLPRKHLQINSVGYDSVALFRLLSLKDIHTNNVRPAWHRKDKIWTCDNTLPKRGLYQTELLSDNINGVWWNRTTVFKLRTSNSVVRTEDTLAKSCVWLPLIIKIRRARDLL